MKLNKRIFDTLNEIREMYKLDVKLPQCIPNGCNIISWEFDDSNDVSFYKQVKDELLFYSSFNENWCRSGNVNLESEVSEDIRYGYEYIYLRLEKKEKFTPKRLLGVETNEGFINKLNQNIKGFVDIGYTTCDPRELKFYISDDSDETVSFDEYLDMFYERE